MMPEKRDCPRIATMAIRGTAVQRRTYISGGAGGGAAGCGVPEQVGQEPHSST